MKKINLLILSILYCGIQAFADGQLLSNPSFENARTDALGNAIFEDWTMPLGSSIETTDVKQGSKALKATINISSVNYIQQEIDVANLPTGDNFQLQIWYKVLTTQGDRDVTIDCFWEHRTDGRSEHDRNVLIDTLPAASDWRQITINTTKPAGATKFHFRVGVARRVVALFDDFGFTRAVPTTPYLSITPEAINEVTATINTTATLPTLTIRQANLTAPTTIEITGANAGLFAASKSSITAEEEELTITFAPTAIGRYQASLIVENPNHPEVNKTMFIRAVCVDPNNPPVITVTPATLPDFSTVAGTTQTQTVRVSSQNCIDDITLRVEHTTGAAFVINESYITKNTNKDINITFRPQNAGNYSSRIILKSGTTQSAIVVSGAATASGTQPSDYATDFNWDLSSPMPLMYEKFDNARHNKQLNVSRWQNVVRSGSRPWWGFGERDPQTNDTIDRYAKATAYIYQSTASEPYEMWLVTPALDYRNAQSKIFTLRVMGYAMPETHNTKLEVYYIDTIVGKGLFKQKLDIGIPSSSDLNGQWSEIHIDLSQQNIADVFFMGFCFKGNSGSENPVTYYIDDVSWGRTDLPVLTPDASEIRLVATPGQEVRSGLINVDVANLTSPVKFTVMGPNKSKFNTSVVELPLQGGNLQVIFKSDNIGLHEATLKISSRGAADKYVKMYALVQNTSDLNQPEDSGISIKTDGKNLIVESDFVRDLSLYTIDGRYILSKRERYMSYTFSDSGIYLLKVGEQTHKIVIR